jgi:hypothetical protein
MDTEAIKNRVRLCIDEGASTNDYDDTSMDAVIENSIDSAILWCARQAPLELLMQSGSGFIKDAEIGKENGVTLTNGSETKTPSTLTLPSDFLRIARLRRDEWHKGITTPISEDSDDYLMLRDETATASLNRPIAVYIAGASPYLELWDGVKHAVTTDAHFSYVTSDLTTIKSGTNFTDDSQLGQAVIYYAAFLTLLAYGDSRAQGMSEVAMSIMK